MKIQKILSLFLCFALFLSLPAPNRAKAAETIISEGAFDYRITAAGAEVAKFYISGSSKVEVPAQVQGYPVVAIGKDVFRNLDNITQIVLPEGLASIGDRAFYACSDLERINLPDSLTSIGEMAFCNCYALGSVWIGAKVKTIGISAFANCTALKSLQVASGSPWFKAVDNVLFSADMSVLVTYPNAKTGKTYTVPEQVRRIEEKAFLECTQLQQVQLPANLYEIDKYAFSGCTSLQRIQIPDSVAIIGTFAFSGCTGLTEAALGAGVTSIPAYAFNGCSKLTSVSWSEELSSIGSRAFAHCATLPQIIIPDSVRQIAADAFQNTTVTQVRFYSRAQKAVFAHLFPNSTILCLCKAAHTYLPADPIHCTVCEYVMDLSSPPVLVRVTADRVELLSQPGFTYSYDQTNWRTDGIFTGLEPNRKYTFYARLENTQISDQISSPLEVTTDRATQPQAPAPKLESATSDTITLVAIPGCEYSLDGSVWQTSPVFTDLQPNTEYTFCQRYAQSQTHFAGAVSQTVAFQTSGKIRLSSKIYIIDPDLIHKIPGETTVQTLLSGIEGGQYCEIYKGDQKQNADAMVGTGMTLKLVFQGQVVETFTLMVTGDTNGDGEASITDMIAVKAHILERTLLTGLAAQAGDTNGDKDVSIIDFIQIKAYILGKGAITPR